MSQLLRYLKALYSLDTLDTRFTTPSSSALIPPSHADAASPPPKEASTPSPRSGRDSEGKGGAARSLWRTPEFAAYYVYLLYVIPYMVWTAYDLSKPSHPTYKSYEHRLSPGWIPGRKADNSDGQYAGFRDNLPYMAGLIVVHPLLRRAYDALFPIHTPTGSLQAAAGAARFARRTAYDRAFAVVFLVALNGFSALKVLLILCANYGVATRLPRAYVPAATWAFNICVLFANELGAGYPWAAIARVFVPVGGTNWGAYLDDYGGLIPRWEVLFNVTVLRLISFNMDYYWMLGEGGVDRSLSPVEKKGQGEPSIVSERDRVSKSAPRHAYTFSTYLGYTLYAPLYLAGPILTFNDYVAQSSHRAPSVTAQRTLLYGVRFLLCLLCMEVLIHHIYAVAIASSNPAWTAYTPFQLSMIGYFGLHHIWLKLLLPWRFFRLWSLVDGLDPPENMARCMSDNYSTLAFWRGWHRSFNRWIVRYVYVPLGGAGVRGARSLANYLAVFTFVALWHDINLRLLVWGWLVVLFIAPEALATIAFPRRKWQARPALYRWICGVGAVANILMMMAANLVGFAIGLDGLKGLVEGIVGSYAGLAYISAACLALFMAAQLMFEHREEEMRHGIKMKC